MAFRLILASPGMRAFAAPIAGLWAALTTSAHSQNLIWSDEFDGPALDRDKWTVSQDCWGGGNDERQCYVDDPMTIRVENGVLRITARRGAATGRAQPAGDPSTERVSRDYSSGRVQTQGRASFRYGRIAVRARLPAGQGLWPAIWMLPEHDNYGPYPLSGEIDIAEAVNLGVRCGGCRDQVRGATHHGASLEANRMWDSATRLDAVEAFHVFALDWTPKRMTWSLDGKPYFSRPTRKPFDERFHLILNLAVGGRWPEITGRRGVDDAALPATLEVDWVRVYETDAPGEGGHPRRWRSKARRD